MTDTNAPTRGEAIRMGADGRLSVPDEPIIPFIEGDGTGPDIWRASVRVLDAAVARAYGGKKKIAWLEVLAGEKSKRQLDNWLPDETVEAYRKYLVGIKGPLTTPVGKGIRSLNVALRQMLDLYVCLRPVRWFTGVPSPVKRPGDVDMVIFRENTEDIYAGIEWADGSPEVKKVIDFLQKEMGVKKIRFPESSGIGIKCVSREGTERLVRASIEYALKTGRKGVTLVHKGNIMKFTEGAFRDWGYAVAKKEFRGQIVTERESWILGNVEKNQKLTVEENAKLIEPGYDMAPADMQADIRRVGRNGARACTHAWQREIQADARHSRFDCRHHAATGTDPSKRVLGHCDPEPQRRLPERRLGRAGGWHRDRTRWEHQLRYRTRDFRSDPWHGAEIRESR